MTKVSFPRGERVTQPRSGPQVSALMVFSGLLAILAVVVFSIARFFESLFTRKKVSEERKSTHFRCGRPQV